VSLLWKAARALVVLLCRRLPRLLVECLIRGYQVGISPLLIGSCKFVPSCSEYFIQAVHEWGVFRGSWLGIRRLLRCRPFTMGGIDPVPKRPDSHGKHTCSD
jgi:putative membrane protein insertion efficiency factor